MQWVRWDAGRRERCGFPEFIYGAGKTTEQLIELTGKLIAEGETALVTRLPPDKGEQLAAACPRGVYDPAAGVYLWRDPARPFRKTPPVLVAGAGSSDLGVAREALLTLEACDCPGEILLDVGVAGLDRLLAETERLRRAPVIIAVAGMEGALASVIGGLVACPVIAVPTSVGYGSARGGETALMAMLSSCASGVVVVNIDNGFGAACAAARILAGERDA